MMPGIRTQILCQLPEFEFVMSLFVKGCELFESMQLLGLQVFAITYHYPNRIVENCKPSYFKL